MKHNRFLAAFMAMSFALIFTGCQQPSSGGDSSSTSQAGHEHTFAEVWSSDATYHWHAATCEHTDEVSGKATHTFGDWETTVAPSLESKGKQKRSCAVCSYEEEQEITYYATAKIGDIVLKDGTFVSPGNFTEAMKENAVAVIVRAKSGDTPALGVGIKHNKTGLAWCTTDANAHDVNITDLQTSKCTDGSDGWSILKEALKTAGKDDDTAASSKYPAWNFCNTYGTTYNLTGALETGWYLPAIAELTTIYNNKTKIDASLSTVGGSQFGTSWYWSCCQYSPYYGYACLLSFTNGSTYLIKSSDYYSVCSVRAFN